MVGQYNKKSKWCWLNSLSLEINYNWIWCVFLPIGSLTSFLACTNFSTRNHYPNWFNRYFNKQSPVSNVECSMCLASQSPSTYTESKYCIISSKEGVSFHSQWNSLSLGIADSAIINNCSPCCSDSASKSGDYSLVTTSGWTQASPRAVTWFCGRDFAISNKCHSSSAAFKWPKLPHLKYSS